MEGLGAVRTCDVKISSIAISIGPTIDGKHLADNQFQPIDADGKAHQVRENHGDGVESAYGDPKYISGALDHTSTFSAYHQARRDTYTTSACPRTFSPTLQPTPREG